VKVFDGNLLRRPESELREPSYNVVSRSPDDQDTTFYSESQLLGDRFALNGKSRELGTATLGGLVVCGVVSIVLDVAQVTLSSAIGALIGGVVAAYLLRGKIGQAATAGALSGLLGTPFIFGIEQILAIFEVLPIPPGPTPSMSELQSAVAIIVTMDLVAGAVGGGFFGAFYRPPKEAVPPITPASTTGAVPAQVRYCVQCGAQLPAGALICPHCNARQPQ
jgi:hypothetical protein